MMKIDINGERLWESVHEYAKGKLSDPSEVRAGETAITGEAGVRAARPTPTATA